MAGNFFSGLADGLNQGVRLGLVFRGLREQEDLRNELAMAAGLGPEVQAKARPATEAEIALAKDPNDAVSQQVMRENAEFGVGYNPADYLPASPMGSDVQGWKLGNTAYGAKPTKGLIAAAQMEARGRAHEKFGDAEKGATLVEKAEDMRLKEIKNIGEQALQAGTYQAIEDAYNLIYNDKQFKRVDLGGGRYRVLHGPIGAPDSLFETVVEGTEPEILDYAAKNIDAKTWADLREQESQIKHRDKLGSYYDWQQQKAEQDYQLETYRRQIEAIGARIKEMPPDAVEEVARLYQERDKLMQAWAGMSQGLSGPVSGGAPTTGSPQAGTIPPAAIYDYLVSKHGVDPTDAIGIVANIEQESGFDPTTLHDKKNGAYTGYGLFGHGGDRRTKLFQHAGNQNPSWTQQLDYAMTESDMRRYLANDYGNDYGRAAADFTRIFERPADTEGDAAKRARKAPGYAGYTQRAISPGLAGSAPQQGLTAQPGTIDPRFMQIAEARKRAAVQPKPMSPEAVASATKYVLEKLDGDTFYQGLTNPNDRATYQRKMVNEYLSIQQTILGGGGGGAGWDANASMGQLANGGKADQPGGQPGGQPVPGSFGEAATAAGKANTDAAKNKAAKESQAEAREKLKQLRAGFGSDWAQGGWLQGLGAVNPLTSRSSGATPVTVQDATAVMGEVAKIYPALSPKDQQAAQALLQDIYRRFPELAPQQ